MRRTSRLVALICFLTVSPFAAAEETTVTLFAEAIEARDDDYVELRTTLLRHDDLGSVLDDITAGEPEWRHQVLADALAE